VEFDIDRIIIIYRIQDPRIDTGCRAAI